MHERTASLEVITGCMSSGKSEGLIRLLRRAEIASLNVVIFKPSTDTRVGAEVCSRNGICLTATEVASAKTILEHVTDVHDVIGIDEAHFFDRTLITVVDELLAQEKRVIVSGLDLDFRGEPFEVMATLIAKAYPIHKLTAVCMQCKSRPATRSERLVESADRELIGDSIYEPRCLSCFSC